MIHFLTMRRLCSPRGWLRGLRSGPPHFTLILFRNSLRKTINGLIRPLSSILNGTIDRPCPKLGGLSAVELSLPDMPFGMSG